MKPRLLILFLSSVIVLLLFFVINIFYYNNYCYSENSSFYQKAYQTFLHNYRNKKITYSEKGYQHYYKYFELIRSNKEIGSIFFDKILQEFDYPSINDSIKLIEIVDKSLLRSNLNHSLYLIDDYKELKNYDFNILLEYLFPFQIENSTLQNQEKVFKFIISRIPEDSLKNSSIVQRYLLLKKHLLEKNDEPAWLLSNRLSFLPNFNALDLLKYKVGTCRDLSDMNTYAGRAVGIPITKDYIIQWPFRTNNHSWNVIIGPKDDIIYFDGINNSNDTLKYSLPKGKVYRNKENVNKKILQLINESKNNVPNVFKNVYQHDVSEKYFKGVDVKLNNDSLNSKFGYLNLFDGLGNWIPIAFSKSNGSEIVFDKVEPKLVYLLSTYDFANIPLSYPFILNKDGSKEFLMPNKSDFIFNVSFDSLRPATPDQYRNDLLKYAEIHGSNDGNFGKYDILFTFSNTSELVSYKNYIKIESKKKYKYYRYFSPLPYKCKLGDIQFHFYKENIDYKNIFFESEGMKSMDNNPLTSYQSNQENAWVGIKLKNQENLSGLSISAPVVDARGNLLPDKKYELYIWENHWLFLTELVKNKNKFQANQVPKNGLFLIKEKKNDNNEGRIFTINDKKQIRWY